MAAQATARAALIGSNLQWLEIVSKSGTQRLDAFGREATLLGKGGAGSVYAHPALPGQAVKIYSTQDRAKAHAAKVRAMLNAPPHAVRTRLGTVQIAWPNATVTQGGGFVGFVMPKINFSEAWTLQQVTQPTQRRRRAIPERLDLRLYAGRNLASVLHSLHELGHYVVDLKPQNVLVYRDDSGRNAAHVALVDCDGFQVREPGGRRFDAELATSQYLHPLVARQVGDEASFDPRLLNDKAALQDAFALAIILFQLLNNALHPMAGRETGASPVPSELALRLQAGGRFYPYGLSKPNAALLPDADSLHTWFDPELRHLFDQAFEGGQPPRPQQWVTVLERLSNAGQACDSNVEHWKLGPVCGQCALAGAAPPAAAVPAPAQVALPPQRKPASRQPSRAKAPPRAAALPKSRAKPVWQRNLVLVAVVATGGAWLAYRVLPAANPQPMAASARGTSSRPVAQLPGGAPTKAVLQSRALTFADDYFRNWSRDGATALAFDSQVYAPEVNYYGKLVSNAAIMETKRDFVSRWPERSYTLGPGALTASCTAALCNISGVVEWDTQSVARKAHSAGSADFSLEVNFATEPPLIVAETGSVISRTR